MKDNKLIPLLPDWLEGVTGVKPISTHGYIQGPSLSPRMRADSFWNPDILLWSQFNKFSNPELTLIQDKADPGNPIQVVQGIPNANGKFKRKAGYMMDTDYYGRAVFEKANVYGSNTKEIVPHVQRCIPLGDEAVGADAPSMGTRMFLVKEGVGGGPRAGTVGSTTNAANPYGFDPFWSELGASLPSNRYNVKEGITVMTRLRLSAETDITNKNIICLANPEAGTASWSVFRANDTSVGITFHAGPGGTDVTATLTGLELGKWHFFVFYISRYGSGKSRVLAKAFDSITGAQVADAAGIDGEPSTTDAPAQNMNLYIGVGESSGGVNTEFQITDFCDGVEIADIMILRGAPYARAASAPFDASTDFPPYVVSANGLAMGAFFMANQHLPYRNYKSGINNAPARRVKNILDARQTYPPSNHGVTPSSKLGPFNEHLSSPVFGDPTLFVRPLTSGSNFDSPNKPSALPGGTIAQSNYVTGADGTISQIMNPPDAHIQTMMFPEMMPALMFSGSGRFNPFGNVYERSTWDSNNRTATPNTSSYETRPRYWRDANRTPFEYRITAPGMVRPGVPHEPTLLLNKWDHTNNTYSQNTEVLGGTIEPFDDSAIPTNASVINKPAVDPAVFEGLDQPLGDHIAIVIDMNPIEDTTIGIDPNEHIELIGSARSEARKNTSVAYYNFTTQKWETFGASGKHFVVAGVSGSNSPKIPQGAPGLPSLGAGGAHGSVWWDSSAPDFVATSSIGRGIIYGAPGQNTINVTQAGMSITPTAEAPFFGSSPSGSHVWSWNPGPMWGKINNNESLMGTAGAGISVRNNGLALTDPPRADGFRVDGVIPQSTNGAPRGANNFSLAPWACHPDYTDLAMQLYPGNTTDYSDSFTGILASSSIAFAGTSGFTIYPDSPGAALSDLKNRARPTSVCGFPYDDRWEASPGQELDMSAYIDQPFLLEKFAVHFDAEIEDSGPQSLGYKLHADRILSPCAIFDDQTTFNQVIADNISIGASPQPQDYPQAVSRYDGDGNPLSRKPIQSYWRNMRSFIPGKGIKGGYYSTQFEAQQSRFRTDAGRGHLLGGNWMHRFDRRKTTPGQAGLIFDDYTDAMEQAGAPGNVICRATGSMQNIFGVDGTYADLTEYQTLYTKPGNGSNSRWRPVALGFRGLIFSGGYRLGAPSYSGGSLATFYNTYGPVGQAGCFQATPGVFLPVSAPLNPSTGLPAYDNFNAVYGTSWPGGFLPILPAAAAGLVTGSQYALSTGLPGHSPSRWGVLQMPLPTHGDFDGGHNYGAPFWRCDTFFLLRQESNSAPASTTRSPVKWTGQMKQLMWENRNYMRRLSNWWEMGSRQTHYEAEWFPAVDKPGYFYGAAAVGGGGATPGNQPGNPRTNNTALISLDERWEFPSQMKLYQLQDGFEANSNIYHERVLVKGGALEKIGNFPYITTTVSTKARELISYAQMTHYGYCTAPDSVIVSSSNGDYKKLAFTQGVKYANTGSANGLPIWVSDMGDPNCNGNLSLGKGAMYAQNCAGSNFPAPQEDADKIPNGDPSPVLARKSLMDFSSYGSNDEKAPEHSSTFYDRIEIWPGRSIVISPVMPSNAGTHPDWEQYGNFERGGSVTGSLPAYSNGNPRTNQWGIGQFKLRGSDFAAKYQSWLDSGLGRDLNIKITPGMTHDRARSQTGNAYVTSSLCSFSILTASTVHRPLHRTGSWSGDLPIVCNLYERRLLNAGHFQLEAPVRTAPSADQSAIHDFVLTIPNGTPMYMGFEQTNVSVHRNNILGNGAAGPGNEGLHSGDWQTELGTNQFCRTAVTKPLVDSWMVRSGSFMPVHAAPPTLARLFGSVKAANPGETLTSLPPALSSILSGNYTAGGSGFVSVYSDKLISGRRFAKGITVPKKEQIALPQAWSGMSFLSSPFSAFTGQSVASSAGGTDAKTACNVAAFQRLERKDGMPDPNFPARGLAMTSSVDQAPQDSLYVLMPSDKLVLGFQPALYGGNPGAGMISNPNISKWGPYDYETSAATGNVTAMTTGSINMEMQYEPARAFTLKSMKSGGKLILYGTLLRNNKHAPSSLKQNLVNNYVHQAIGDDTVADQFLISSRNALQGTYLDMHYAGDAFATYQKEVATFRTGSIPSAVSAADPFWATSNRLRAMVVRSGRSLFVSQSAFQPPSTYSNLHISGSVQRFVTLVDKSEVYYDSLGLNVGEVWAEDGLGEDGGTGVKGTYILTPNDVYEAGTGTDFREAFNSFWPRSFPFENRYKNVSRLSNRNPRFGLRQAIAAENVAHDENSTLQHIQVRLDDQFDTTIHADYVDHVNTANSDPYKRLSAALFGFSKPQTMGYYYTGPFTLNPIPTIQPFTILKADGSPSGADNEFHHPAGVKYGFVNYDHLPTTARYRPDRYGQLRDCFEQRKYTKFLKKASENSPEQVTEAAVSCIFIDGDGNPLEDGSQTSCMNISHFMTSSIPYKEGETPSRNPIVNEQLVTISSLVGTRFR